MNITLRPYQQQIFASVRQAFRDGFNAPILAAPTGSGKTVIFSHVAEGAARRDKNILILVHRQELLMQCSWSLDSIGVSHGLIAPGHSRTADHVQVASVQTLVRRLDKVMSPDLIVIDECFPAGTLIDGRNIETIKPGDIVTAFNTNTRKPEQANVLNTMKRTARSLTRITLSDRKQIVCTPEHPFYLSRFNCYCPAAELKRGDQLLIQEIAVNDSENKMQGLRKSIRNRNPQDNMFTGMLEQGKAFAEATSGNYEMRRMWQRCDLRRPEGKKKGISWQSVLFRKLQTNICIKMFQPNNEKNKSKIFENICRKNAKKQSNEKCKNQRKGFAKSATYGMEAGCAYGEWVFNKATRNSGASIKMGNGSLDSHQKRKEFGISDLLQGRCWKQRFKNRYRSTWKFASCSYQKSTRREKANIFGVAWVDRIDILESGSDGTFEGLCPDGYVYNIEVEQFNNYFANGVLVHNCHHSRAGSWSKILSHFPGAKLLGVTATPCRLDGRGLGKLSGGHYDTLIQGPQPSELIAAGYITQPIIYAPPSDLNMHGVHKIGGDFNRKENAARVEKSKITGDCVAHYLKICPGQPAIAFCASIKHAQRVTEEFRAAGIISESLDGKMSDRDRKWRIDALGGGTIQVLTSCDIISEGTDIPVVAAAILLRPTQSTGLYLQQLGRAMRPFPGKKYTIILDHVGNVYRHGLPDIDRQWTLDGGLVIDGGRAANDTVQYYQCQSCYAVYAIHLSVCPQCGSARMTKDRSPEFIDGELSPLEAQKALAEKMAEESEHKRQYWLRRRENAHAETLEDLKAIARARGYKESWAHIIWNSRLKKNRQTA